MRIKPGGDEKTAAMQQRPFPLPQPLPKGEGARARRLRGSSIVSFDPAFGRSGPLGPQTLARPAPHTQTRRSLVPFAGAERVALSPGRGPGCTAIETA